MHRFLLSLAACLMLAACGGAEPIWAPEAAVQAATFVSDAPPSVTLFTVINNTNGSGAHSGLLINGSQRVIFDPAGSWKHPKLPERNDVHFGMSDRMVAFYIDYHARETYRVVEQTRQVTPEVAALVMRRAMEYGAVPKAQCSNSISTILGGVPGFETISNTWFPKKLSAQFDTLPGVVSRVITDVDADDNHGVLLVQADGSPG
jgi:hypothetical protein